MEKMTWLVQWYNLDVKKPGISSPKKKIAELNYQLEKKAMEKCQKKQMEFLLIWIQKDLRHRDKTHRFSDERSWTWQFQIELYDDMLKHISPL